MNFAVLTDKPRRGRWCVKVPARRNPHARAESTNAPAASFTTSRPRSAQVKWCSPPKAGAAYIGSSTTPAWPPWHRQRLLQDTCSGLVQPDRGATCLYQAGRCACDGVTSEPLQAGVETIPYVTDGNRISLNSFSPSTGTFCVTDERLTIMFDTPGSFGWGSWILER